MPGSHKHHKKVYSTSSESSSESYVSDSLSFCEKKKHHKKEKKHCKKSESDSTIETYSNDKDHHHKKKKYESSSSSSDCEEKYNICDIYDYFRNRLLEDNGLMVAGSNAYINATNSLLDVVPVNHSLQFNTLYNMYNIDMYNINSPFFVREDGVYIVFISILLDTAAQFTLFVNGVPENLTCVGTNSGAGQVISRHLLKLKKDDNVVIRNYISTTSSFTANLYAGGTLPGLDMTFLMMKFSPLNPVPNPTPEECCELTKCLSKDKKKLFNCLTEKLLCDKELMVKGFNVTGTFSLLQQVAVPLENQVVYDTQSNVNGLLWNPSGSNPAEVQILEDGIYKIFFVCSNVSPAQLSFMVDGVPVTESIQGSNKGAGQISLRVLLELRKNQVVSVINHTSAAGTIVLSNSAGGSGQSVSALLTIFKAANIIKPCIKQVDCKLAKRFECYYEKFRTYLLCKECLMINGTPYISTVGSNVQTLALNDPLFWSTNYLLHDVNHQSGDELITIEKSGLYDIWADVATDQPVQLALFVNNVVDPLTVFARDSGANRCLLRQFVKLNKGDNISVKNYNSFAGTVTTSQNAGGNYIGNNILFGAFMLHPECQCLPQVPKNRK